MLHEFGGAAFSKFTAALAELATNRLTPIGEEMRRLMAETGLRDAVVESGLGWLPTFPGNGLLPPLVALDHVLVSGGLAASSAWTEAVPGQEHRALFVTVGVAE